VVASPRATRPSRGSRDHSVRVTVVPFLPVMSRGNSRLRRSEYCKQRPIAIERRRAWRRERAAGAPTPVSEVHMRVLAGISPLVSAAGLSRLWRGAELPHSQLRGLDVTTHRSSRLGDRVAGPARQALAVSWTTTRMREKKEKKEKEKGKGGKIESAGFPATRFRSDLPCGSRQNIGRDFEHHRGPRRLGATASDRAARASTDPDSKPTTRPPRHEPLIVEQANNVRACCAALSRRARRPPARLRHRPRPSNSST